MLCARLLRIFRRQTHCPKESLLDARQICHQRGQRYPDVRQSASQPATHSGYCHKGKMRPGGHILPAALLSGKPSKTAAPRRRHDNARLTPVTDLPPGCRRPTAHAAGPLLRPARCARPPLRICYDGNGTLCQTIPRFTLSIAIMIDISKNKKDRKGSLSPEHVKVRQPRCLFG